MFAKMPLQKLENDRARAPRALSRREESGEMGRRAVVGDVKIVNRGFRLPTCTSLN
jgi:hypothetical protein